MQIFSKLLFSEVELTGHSAKLNQSKFRSTAHAIDLKRGQRQSAQFQAFVSRERIPEANIVWIKSHGRYFFSGAPIGHTILCCPWSCVRDPFIFVLRWHMPRDVWIIYGLTDRSSQSHSLRAHRSASHACTILRDVSTYWGHIFLFSPWNLLPVSRHYS
jgi:hypothetical protein